MKLQEFVPDIANTEKQLIQSNTMLKDMYDGMGFKGFLKSSYGGNQGMKSAINYMGIEQLYFDWLRTAYAYRRMFIQDLYLLAYDTTEIRTPLLHLKGEIFRKGLDEWHAKFVTKCNNCGKEYQEDKDKCDKCDGDSFSKPDPEQLEVFDKFRKDCNIFHQTLDDVCQMTSDDINIVDDFYIWINKQYQWISNKLHSRVVEIRRIHPALIEIDLDKSGLPRNSHWICPFHRDEASVKPDKCKECGIDMIPAMYIYNHRGRRVYLFEDEMVHKSKFSPSETYGYSPLLTVMQKVLTISGMDRFLYRYFFERKAPTGMILTYTDDPQSLEIERARVEAKMMEDPTYIPWIAVSQRTGRGRTDFVRLFHTLQEMDYLNIRNEIRDRISMIYGVPQIYMNVMEGVGGLSGQSQQLKMFSNVIEADQRRYNEDIFPYLLKLFNITDWEIKLRTPEEKIESVILQQAQQKVGIASQMRMIGFDVALKSGSSDISTLDFVFSGTPPSMEEQQMMGGGMPIGQPGVPGVPQEAGGAVPIDENGNPVDPAAQQIGAQVNKALPMPTHLHQHGNHPAHLRNQPHWPDEKHRLEELQYLDEDEDW